MGFDWLIAALPLAAFLIIGIGSLSGRWMDQNAHLVAVPAVLGSFLFSVIGFFQVIGSGPRTLTLYTWGVSGSFQATLDIRMDALTASMLLLVTVVSSAVHVYTIGYMHGDRGYARFFAYLGLFTFSMIMLVVARNLLQLYIFWEAVGLCSYLLIAHYYEKPSAGNAATKAFVVNRVGDFGFALGIFLIFYLVGSIDYDVIFERLPAKSAEVFSILGLEFQAVTLIALLLFIGAVGKSAQFPLHVWLPDAMEGPTPISALIHAATMVTAGVFMVARLNPIFGLSPAALGVIAVVGAGTAVFAATIAITQTDIKRVVAYSTVSQLGYMMMACGLGATVAGVFHLLTHGAFKALLFLCCGSVIHALSGEQDLRRMGGLKNHLPVTYKTFFIGALALAGIPPLAGFVSKDEILFRAFTSGGAGIFFWAVGAATAFLTAFYSFRLIYTIFHGESRVDPDLLSGKKGHGVHESPSVMTLPLILLAFLSVTVGWTGLPIHGWNGVDAILAPLFPLDEHHEGSGGLQIALMLVSVAVAFGGWMAARYVYLVRPELPGRLAEKAGALYRGSLNKWYVDEFYDRVFVQPTMRAADAMWRFIDVRIVDGAVNGVGKTALAWARGLRLSQTGQMQHYALVMVAGTFVILTVYLVFF
ncbi:MAG TPA: NADH-quinone oxidoreductase subunit L [Nitrospiria bacterium]|nr:NADH-quinone oxidoreductase subunit L [Nitrospiria bacterium]